MMTFIFAESGQHTHYGIGIISIRNWENVLYSFIYFYLTFSFQIGSFFMINLCLVVIATQFAETKKREMERMRQERARFTSTSTLASSTNNSEPTTCYAEIVKYIAHLYRRFKRRLIKKLRLYKYGLIIVLFHLIIRVSVFHPSVFGSVAIISFSTE